MSPAATAAAADPGSEDSRADAACVAVAHMSMASAAIALRVWKFMGRAYTVGIVNRLPVYFISHGGGPWSFMDDPARASYNQDATLVMDVDALRMDVRAEREARTLKDRTGAYLIYQKDAYVALDRLIYAPLLRAP